MARGWILDGGRRADQIVDVLLRSEQDVWTAHQIARETEIDPKTADKILWIMYWAGEVSALAGCEDFRGLCHEVARRTDASAEGVAEIVTLVCQRRLRLERPVWKQGYLWRLRPATSSD